MQPLNAIFFSDFFFPDFALLLAIATDIKEKMSNHDEEWQFENFPMRTWCIEANTKCILSIAAVIVIDVVAWYVSHCIAIYI